MKPPHALISGAGIAGLTAAHWLRRSGWRVTVVERARQLRAGGQAVDVRGAAVEVLSRMGIVSRVRASATGMRGMTMVDENGKQVGNSKESTFTGGVIDNDDIEIFRDALNAIIASTLDDGVEFRFGDSVAALRNTPGRVTAAFESAAPADFDVVIGADGLRSRTRKLAFGPHRRFLWDLGSVLGIFTFPNYLGLDHWQIVQHLKRSTAVVLSAPDPSEARAVLGCRTSAAVGNAAESMDELERQYAGVGWEIPELLRRMRTADDYYYTSMAQVHMESWHRGRVVLVGDAGYCGSPLTGQGTSMALVGGYVLAHELATGDVPRALPRYERGLREYVRRNQALAEDAAGRVGSPLEQAGAANAIVLPGVSSGSSTAAHSGGVHGREFEGGL